MIGFELPNHRPAKLMFSLCMRSLYDSLLIIKYRGKRENLDDLKTGMPSVFHVREMLSALD